MEKAKILSLINETIDLCPLELEKDLKPIDEFPDVTDWHSFEDRIWEIGEEIRQIIHSKKSLRNDEEINNAILNICLNNRAKRGRQSFILLLGYKKLSHFAPKLIKIVDDKFVTGQVIDTICKMQVKGFEKEIEPFTRTKDQWIRKIALKYLKKFSN